MEYEASITIPANTSKTSPTEVTLKVFPGIITRVMVRPRPGHAALAHLVILHFEFQLYPLNLDGDFHGDTFPIEWDDFQELTSEPSELRLRGWNDDDTYAHTFDVSIVVIDRKWLLPFAIAQSIGNLIRSLFPRRVSGGGG